MLFEFLFNPLFYFGILFFFIFISLFSFFHSKKKIFLWILFFCKAIFLALLFFIFLQPYSLQKTPSNENYSIGILNDVSQSMATRDCLQNFSRIEILNSLFKKSTNNFDLKLTKLTSHLQKNYSLQNYNFVSSLQPTSDAAFTLSSGNTDLANVLKQIEKKPNINSIFIFSDGITANEKKVLETIEKFKQKKITVNTIGIGEKKKVDDLQVAFLKPPKKVAKNTQFNLAVEVKNFFSYKITTEIELFENELFVAKKKVTLNPFSSNTYQFEQVSFDEEKKFYKIKIPLQKNEILTYNNMDYATVKIIGSKKYNIFYYSESLSSEYKYLKQLIAKDKNLNLTSLIAMNEKRYFTEAGVQFIKQAQKKFSVKNLMNQEIIILGKIRKDSKFFNLTNRYYQNFKNSLTHKGIGLLVYGQKFENTALQKIMATSLKNNYQNYYNRKQQKLSLRKDSIFLKKKKTFFVENPISLPKNKNVSAFNQDNKKWNYDLLLNQQSFLIYRSLEIGKMAILGLPTQQWFVEELNFYNEFWYSLLEYLLSPSPKKITLLNHHKKYSNREIDLTVDVLGDDFLGDENANVEIELTYPKQKQDEQQKINNFSLTASSRIKGRYQQKFLPPVKGEYFLKVIVKDKNQQKKSEMTSSFLVYNADKETQYFSLNEKLLKNIASETAGKYYHYLDDFDSKEKVKILTASSWLEEKVELFTNWLYLLLLFGFLFVYWFLRRNFGLK